MTIDYAQFPNLLRVGHRKTSEPSSEENCIAHAVGARGEWWEPAEGRKWPIGPPYDNNRTESLVRILEALGYVECPSDEYEPGYDKVAVYTKDGEYSHAARQLPGDGGWTSKLGVEDDIMHANLDALSGGVYGVVAAVMRRPSRPVEESACCERGEPLS